MKIKYDCGCEYRFSGFISQDGTRVLPDYVDDDGHDYILCERHKHDIVENKK